jgi:endonuclease/exonuclease/phosphatase (EEP) superfamily protein YafD
MGRKGERFRLVSANLARGKADPCKFRDLVEGLTADVVVVQELAPEQAATLAEIFPFGKLQAARDWTGMGIALREPGSVVHVPLPYRGGWATNLMHAGAPAPADSIEILNVHVVAPHSLPTWRTIALRRAQLRALETYLDATPRRRRVVVGDLNSTPIWPAYRRLTRRFGDAALEAAQRGGHRPPRTWRPHHRLPYLLRIDHVLAIGLTAHEVRVVPIHGSDHGALVVDLSIRD